MATSSSWQVTSSDAAPTLVGVLDAMSDEDEEEQKENEEENEEVDYDNHGSSSCQMAIIASANSKRILFAMSIGLTDDDDGSELATSDLAFEPYKSSRGKKTFCPQKKDLQTEVGRRALTRGLPPPKCNNWSVPKLCSHLQDHPVTDIMDVAYLKKEVVLFRTILQEAAIERSRMLRVSLLQTSSQAHWNQQTYMRFCHALADDSVKETFMHRHDTLNRPELDARNSAERPPTFEEACAQKFNDPSFVPMSLGVPSLHEDFATPIPLDFDESIGLISPDQVKSRFADTKTKLTLVSEM